VQRYGDQAAALSSLGYKQAAEFLRGEVSEEEAIRLAQQGHRNYAKRQMTWFRREPGVAWLHSFGDAPEAQSLAQQMVSNFLSSSSG